MSGQQSREYQQAEQAFVLLNGLQQLQQLQQQTSYQRPVMFAELVHYTFGMASVDEQRIQAQLSTDLRLRQQFNTLVAERRFSLAPAEARAQHSDHIEQRQGAGFVLKFRPSRANPEQVYTIVELQREIDIEVGKCVILVGCVNDEVMRLVFPPPVEAKTQAILLDTDPRLEILRHSECEISLLQQFVQE